MPLDTEFAVTVMGLGYIGLPTAAIIARTGAMVTGVDVTPSVVETINSGRVHIEEVDLDGLVSGVVSRGLLRAALTVAPADVFVIAVPTPFTEARQPDITYVLEAARAVAPVLKTGDTVILESTSPVGTTEQVRDLIATLRPDLKMPGLARAGEQADLAIAYCPERVLPGRILVELIDNDRVIGGITPRCARKALAFYRRFVRGACVTTTARAAEMTKLTENAFRDVNIAFANELSLVADTLGVDVWEVIRLANRHPRVNILSPGPGVGGHCIAVDPWFLVAADPQNTPLIRTAREVNDGKTAHIIARASAMIEAQGPDRPVACLGLAFKANIDDFRESPALKVAAALARRFGARIRIVEPYARSLPSGFDGTGATLIDIDTALETCDAMVVLVDHDIFRSVPLEERRGKTVLDTRGLWPDQA
ncbi:MULTISPECIES: UDP-N-acetyl-D-mannosamine dehydrogenase [unclassified Sphingomonas]|uniref:UDP-N-acetyl-D-mannosamine dehydrogenase n=1 Tax=unclassified Sphingomonas TaxID=196159 RepID=UPI002858545D|nr:MULTISPECIES: UDP-N-acetyl-D-mannosamine dehydrogenase [unclassified Sphingomonas]MDR6113154.1 UDP-N-acetyl-D-mannosaminuronic acid dehydrogenase [Sphingomonas sp. SORGH_AS_0789]MDR6149485.1 UDP-N-acetyl-D-mannosaminuronic acid dehydrogenase [Sphingomonas sp. SORGH_AS_0742]